MHVIKAMTASNITICAGECPFCLSKVRAFCNYCSIMSMHGAAPAITLTFCFFSCFMFLSGNRVCRKNRGADEIHSIARSNLKLARQKHKLLLLLLFWFIFLIQKMFALTLTPGWKHRFIMTQWINIYTGNHER